MTDEKEKNNGFIEVLKEDYYFKCPRHDIPYPKGSTCPACDAEAMQQSVEKVGDE